MKNKFNDEILREFDEIITKYQIDESYFDLVDGYMSLEKFLLTTITKAREDEKEKVRQLLLNCIGLEMDDKLERIFDDFDLKLKDK